MIDRDLDIQTRDGLMNTFVTYPEEGGPFPVVIFYMDAPGKREELHAMARRIGTAGYYVVLPNLYYRTERNFVIDPSDATRARMFELMNSINSRLVIGNVHLTWARGAGEKWLSPAASGASVPARCPW